MADPLAASPTPSVLLVTERDWTAMTLDTILAGAGYAVVRAMDDVHATFLAAAHAPDLLVVDGGGSAARFAEACALPGRLRDAGLLSAAAPVVVTSSEPARRADVLEALAAGVWEVCQLPLDASLLLARLGVWGAAKRVADRATEASLVEPTTGTYTLRGLLRRARELGAEAGRAQLPLACIAMTIERSARAGSAGAAARSPEAGALAGPPSLVGDDVGGLVHRAWSLTGRASDAFGRAGRTEFVVLAPGTTHEGGERLATRLNGALHRVWAADAPAGAPVPPPAVRTVVRAAEPSHEFHVDAVALLGDALVSLGRPTVPAAASRDRLLGLHA